MTTVWKERDREREDIVRWGVGISYTVYLNMALTRCQNKIIDSNPSAILYSKMIVKNV